MIAGFTGTRHGMSRRQLLLLTMDLRALRITKLHHGCCVGGDDQANTIARELGIPTVGHPPAYRTLQAHCEVTEMRKRFPYIERNHNIVDEVEVLFVGPLTNVEVLRSGTWATYRYTVSCGMDIVLLTR